MGEYTTRCLEESEYRKIILLLRTGYEYNGVKHRPNDQIATILVLQANLGCRIGDIMNLTTDSIIKDGSIHRFNIIEQKTGKKRTFIVPQPVVDFIEDYKKHTPIGADGKLFDICAHAVRKQLRAVTSYIGISEISTHSFRKRFACEIYTRTNHDIMAVCQALQHASTKTTMTYIKRSDAQIESAINQIVSIA